jgi:tripartite ATP-independent transporter DctP family solute receptor
MNLKQLDRRRFTRFAGSTLSLALPNINRKAPRRLRLGHNNTTVSITHAGAVAFASALYALSDGGLACDVFPNATIGDETQMMTAVADGTLDASVNMVGTTTPYAREISLVEMPYLFADVASARRAYDGILGQHCADLLKAKGIFVAGWGEYGLRHVTANKPIHGPADLKGLKIRVQVSDPTLQTFLALGAAAETLPFTQLPEALRIGRFEAQENPFGIIVPSKLYMLQTHLSLTGHIYTPSLFVMSTDMMDGMSPSDRALIVRAGAAGGSAMRAFSDAMDREGPARLRAAGMTIVENVDRAALKRGVEHVGDVLSRTFGSDAVKRMNGLAAG